MGIAFDPSTVANVTLSNGNLTGTNTATTNPSGCKGLAADAKAAGLLYFEVTGLSSNGGSQASIGLNTQATTMANQVSVGGASGGIGLYQGGGGSVFGSGSNTGISIGTTIATDVVAVAVDLKNQKVWFKNVTQGLNWNGSPSANPFTNVGGASVTASPLVPFLGWGGGGSTGVAMTANFKGPFTGTVPSFYEPWDDSGDAYTSFDPASIGTGVTLSANNRIINWAGSSVSGAFGLASDAKSVGKVYFEFRFNTKGAGNDGNGVALTTATFADVDNSGTKSAVLLPSGNFYTNGGLVFNIGPAACNNGDVIAVAVDLGGPQIWMKNLTQAGNWNNNAGANPATNALGAAIPAGAIVPVSVYQNGSVANSSFNFGAAPFVGAVPSGFAAGWFAATLTPATPRPQILWMN